MEVALRTPDEDGALSPGPADERGFDAPGRARPARPCKTADGALWWPTEPEGRNRSRFAAATPRSLRCHCTGGPIRTQRFALGERAPRQGYSRPRAFAPDRSRGTAGLELSLANCTVARHGNSDRPEREPRRQGEGQGRAGPGTERRQGQEQRPSAHRCEPVARSPG